MKICITAANCFIGLPLVKKAAELGWTYKTELEDGIRLAYEDFLNNPMRAER